MFNKPHYLGLLLLFLISCSGPHLQSSQQTNPQAAQQRQSYQGPIELIIDPGMQTATSRKPISWTAKDEAHFGVKTATPSQPVFEHVFTLDENGNTSFQSDFDVTNITKRYSMRVEYLQNDDQVLGYASVSLNNQSMFDHTMLGSSRFWQKDKIILPKQNALNLYASGPPGLAFKVSLSEAEDAGAVFLRQAGPTVLPQTLPEELKSIRPNEGDQYIHSIPTGAISVNQAAPMHFESGMLTVEFHDKEAGLTLLKDRYSVQVDSTLEIDEQEFYYLFPNLATSPLQHAERVIHAFNQAYQADIQQIRSSSLAALQLFLIKLEIQTKHQDLLKAVSFNGINPHLPIANSEIVASDTTSELMHDDPFFGTGSASGTLFGSSSNAKRIGRNWALRDTRALEAWRYSIGTGVKVAWLDLGYGKPFSIPANGVNFHPELEDRRKTDSIDFIAPEKNDQNHGISSLMAGFAEKGNDLGSAGTAPNANVAMYNVASVKQFAEAIMKSIAKGVDVIGMNQSWGYSGDNNAVSQEFIDLVAAIDSALKKNIPVTIPAHNYGQTTVPGHLRSAPRWPIGLYQEPRLKDLIVVNAAGINFDPSLGDTRVVQSPGVTNELSGTVRRDEAFFGLPNNQESGLIGWFEPIKPSLPDDDPCKHTPWIPGCFGYGSGFDHINKQRSIWAPGQRVLHYDSNGTIRATSGTSVANPFVTGVVALMKSRNPDLTPAQILSLLRNNSFLKVRANPEMRLLGINDDDSKMVDVSSALIRAIDPNTSLNSLLNTDFQNTYRSKQWIGEIKGSGANKSIATQLDVLAGNSTGTKLLQSISTAAWNNLTAGKKVLLTGWKGNGKIKLGKHKTLGSDEIEVLEYQDLINKDPVIDKIQIFQQGREVGKMGQGSVCTCADFVIQVKGKYFYHNNSPKPLRIRAEGLDIPLTYNLSPSLDPNREYINQDGTLVQLYIQAGEKDINGNTFLASRNDDKIAFRIESSQNASASALYPEEINRLRFNRSNPEITNNPETIPPLPEKGYGTLSLSNNPPTSDILPEGPDQYIYDKTGNRWLVAGTRLSVNAHDFVGIRFNQPIRNLEVKIGPIVVPIIDVLRDLAVIGIPEDLPAGVHDLTVKASGSTLSLEQVVEKVSDAIPVAPENSPPPSGNPGEYNSVRIYNLEGNDEGRVYLNAELILTGHAGQDVTASIGLEGAHPLRQDRRNEIRFELTNNGGGYTYGFELAGRGTTYYRDEKGTPNVKNVIHYDGSEDQTQGLVYNERMVINSKVSPLGSGPYWFKVFNLNPDEVLTFEANNDTDDIAWKPNGSFRITGAMGTVSRSIPLQTLSLTNYCATANPWGEHWNYAWINLYLQNPQGPYSLGIEIYKGINLVYRNIQGQAGHWGAENNLSTDSVSIPPFVGPEYCHYGNS